MNKTIIILFSIVFLASLVFAHDDHDKHSGLEQGEAIINAEIPCGLLSLEQLENVGEYLMQKKHPGEIQNIMEDLMGGKGSVGLKHTQSIVAKIHYCKVDNSTMINGGLMKMMDGYSMMGSIGMGLWSLFYVAIAGFVFGLTFWCAHKIVVKK